jgi:hypothetical protein
MVNQSPVPTPVLDGAHPSDPHPTLIAVYREIRAVAKRARQAEVAQNEAAAGDDCTRLATATEKAHAVYRVGPSKQNL